MDKIFLDCGQYDGVAIKQYCVDDSWTIYSFEPTPKKLEGLPKLKLFKKAIWIRNGRMKFEIDPRHGQGSHLIDTTSGPSESQITVSTLDFSKFVSELPEVFIVCSMDIEGSEFPVLRKMIDDGTIKRINVLDIEFHHRLMADYDTEDARKLIQELWYQGVLVRLKVVLE